MAEHPSTKLLDDFEHGDLTRYETNHTFVKSYSLSLNEEKAKEGTTSLKLSYDFGGWTTGNGAMYIQFHECLQTDTRPVKLGMWVYGDGKSPWLRATLIDGEKSRKTINLTAGNIDWVGWKYVDAPLDQSWKLPLQLEKIYAVETDKSHQGDATVHGEFYIDLLQFVYRDDQDLQGPVFTDISPKRSIVYSDSFLFSARVFDAMSGVDADSIQMKVDGKAVPHSYTAEEGQIHYLLKDLHEGEIRVEVEARDMAGNRSLPSLDRTLTIDLSPDKEKPFITDLTPRNGITIDTDKPRITFNVKDKKSGINAEDISVRVDNRAMDVVYDETTGWCYTYPEQPLPVGEHMLEIKVKDRAGNQLGPIKERFFTRLLKEPDIEEPVKIAVIPDTHSPAYLKHLGEMIAEEDAPLVIHMGDMVDEATEAEFEEVNEALTELNEKTLLTVPGNHESFQGNLDSYQQLFGAPTYHLNFGDTLIIVLNSSFEQSISQSDSTQIHYLKRLLLENTKNNIVIATHVPVKDTFGTSHQMVREDAEEFENLLSSYKERHQDVNITVLFGHLHVLQKWEKNGVSYVITGNGAGKGYVAHEKGNLLGYGILHISRFKVKYNFKPLVKKLFIQPSSTKRQMMLENYVEVNRGKMEPLHVFGIVDVLASTYTANLTHHPSIQLHWTTSDETIVTVSPMGVVSGKKEGSAMVTVMLEGANSYQRANIMIGVSRTESPMDEES